MWRQFVSYAFRLLDLVGEVTRLRKELGETKAELELIRAENLKRSQDTRDLVQTVLHLKETERLEREKLMLRLELELTKFDRRLPPGKDHQE
jgi:hypothetical protein